MKNGFSQTNKTRIYPTPPPLPRFIFKAKTLKIGRHSGRVGDRSYSMR